MNSYKIAKLFQVLMCFFLVGTASARVYNVVTKSVKLSGQDGAEIEIRFRSETVSTPGSSAVNTSAEQIQIRVDLGQKCSTKSNVLQVQLHGITNDQADVIQILQLRKINDCVFLGSPVYSLVIASSYSGQSTAYAQTLDVETTAGVSTFTLNLGQ